MVSGEVRGSMRTDHSSLEADTGLRVERLGVVVLERQADLVDYGIFAGHPALTHCTDILPPFAPWWTDERRSAVFAAEGGMVGPEMTDQLWACVKWSRAGLGCRPRRRRRRYRPWPHERRKTSRRWIG